MKKLWLIIALASPSWAFAIGQGGITPTMVGSEGNGVSDYIGISPNPNNCLYAGVYFTSGDVKTALSVALSAKVSGKTLRIEYTQAQPGAVCYGSSIYVE
jgi:hypothetical protein